MQQVTVRVPASTSNLGPGFDCLGVALRIYNDVTVTRGGKFRRPLITREAARLFFAHARRAPFSFSVSIKGSVPASRGLGGSATIRLGILHARFEVSPRLYFVLLIPDLEIKTSTARNILPSRIARADAVDSCANACAITAAFAACNYSGLRGTFADQFHQPFRQKLIPFLPRAIAAAEEAGALGAFLSGSGSTIAAVTLKNPQKIAEAMRRKIDNHSAGTIIVSADNRGARFLKIRNSSDVPLA